MAAELTALKQDTNLGTTGSATLVRWLLEQGLVDELHLLVHPIVVGQGKKLFEDGATVPLPAGLVTDLLDRVVYLVYGSGRRRRVLTARMSRQPQRPEERRPCATW